MNHTLGLARRMHWRGNRRRFRYWSILFLFHQFFTLPTVALLVALSMERESRVELHFAPTFVPVALTLALVVGASTVLYVRRQIRKRREETAAFERFTAFRDAQFEYREKTGRFPTTLQELGKTVDAKYRNPFYNLEFRCLSNLDVGVIGASAKPWRAPFAPWGFGLRMFVALEDGSTVIVRGRRAVDFFDDVVWVAETEKDVGKFYLKKNKLRFKGRDHSFKLAAAIDNLILLSEIALIFAASACLFQLIIPLNETLSFEFLERRVAVPYAVVLAFCVLFGLVPLPLGEFYLTIAGAIFGWILQ